MRRIARFPSTIAYSDVSISPQWHQWLRHTRDSPPSLSEQSSDIARQENLKVLAAEADRRWAAKPSLLDAPEHDTSSTGHSERKPKAETDGEHIHHPSLETVTAPDKTSLNRVPQKNDGQLNKGSPRQDAGKTRLTSKKEPDVDPWGHLRGSSGESWQPKTWEGYVTSPRQR